MSNPPIVSVRGEAVREVDPELASVTVTVSARDRDRQATLTRLSERAEAARQLIDGYAQAIERVETGAVNVYPETARSGERVTAYTGSVATTVTFHDFTALGEIILRLSDADQTSVYGPSWSLRPDSPVHRDARHAAIGDALVRAREYAEAVGASVVRLLEIADVGMNGSAQPMAYGMTAFAARESGGADLGLQLQPGQQTVRAQVEARFEISEPTRLS